MDVKRQEQHAAEQLNAYIDASQQGKQPRGESPFVDQLLVLANSIEAKPALAERMTHSMHTKPGIQRHVRWASVAAALALAVLAFMTVPALRSFAQDIIAVLSVQKTDQNPALQPTLAPPAGVNPEDSLRFESPSSRTGLTLDQVRTEVRASSDITFDLVTPAYLPTGFGFDTGIVDEFGRMVLLTYVSADRLSLFDVRLYDLANPNPGVKVEIPLGASSTVEAVTINGQAGQYVRGEYGAEGVWDATAPVQTLTWRGDEVLYVLTTHEQGVKISQQDLLAIAESISP